MKRLLERKLIFKAFQRGLKAFIEEYDNQVKDLNKELDKERQNSADKRNSVSQNLKDVQMRDQSIKMASSMRGDIQSKLEKMYTKSENGYASFWT